MMTLAKTYSTVTEESIEQADYADTGFEFEARPAKVREVVEALLECTEPSCLPLCDAGHPCWASTEFETTDFRTGERTCYSYHIGGITPHQRKRLFRIAKLIK